MDMKIRARFPRMSVQGQHVVLVDEDERPIEDTLVKKKNQVSNISVCLGRFMFRKSFA